MSAEKASKDVNKSESSIFPALQAISSLENVISLLDTESWSFPEKAEMKRKLQEFVEVIQNDSSNIMTGDSKEVSPSKSVLPVQKKFRSVTVQTDESMFPIINDIPNECLTLILKLIPLQELLQLRIVCFRWKENIDSYCGSKKTLKIISSSYRMHLTLRDYAREIYYNKLYDRALNSADDLLIEEDNFGTDGLNFLTKTFKNIKHLTLSGFGYNSESYHNVLFEHWHDLQSLSLKCAYDYKFSKIENSISSLHSLRRLDLLSDNITATQIPKNILAKLEHFTINFKSSANFEEVVSNLNSNCKVQLQIWGHRNLTKKFTDLDSAASKIIHLQVKNSSFNSVPNFGKSLTNLTYFELEIPERFDLNLYSLMKIIVSMKSLEELHVWRLNFKKIEDIFDKLQKSGFSSPAKRVSFTHSRIGLNCSPKVLCVVLSNLFPDLQMLLLHTGGNNVAVRQELRENLKMFPKLIEGNIM